MTCRKRRDEIKTGRESLARDKNGRQPAYCPFGLRHEEGVSLILAYVWNLGTCRLDEKGATQVAIPQVSEYRCEAQGRSNPYERRRFCNGTGAKGLRYPALTLSQPARGGA
jgi:hypothetical protein